MRESGAGGEVGCGGAEAEAEAEVEVEAGAWVRWAGWPARTSEPRRNHTHTLSHLFRHGRHDDHFVPVLAGTKLGRPFRQLLGSFGPCVVRFFLELILRLLVRLARCVKKKRSKSKTDRMAALFPSVLLVSQ